MADRWANGRNATEAYKTRLAALVKPGMKILHAGCGWDKNEVSRPFRHECKVVGVDLDPRVKTMFHSEFHLASLEALPFPAETFDLIVSEYVFEHLTDPGNALEEMTRVLKREGTILILTPNAYSYKTLAARLTPQSLHVAAGRHRYGVGHEKDMYSTLYRCNTKRAFEALGNKAGLQIQALSYVTNGPTWFAKIPGLFELFHVFHLFIRTRVRFEQLRCAMIVELKRV